MKLLRAIASFVLAAIATFIACLVGVGLVFTLFGEGDKPTASLTGLLVGVITGVVLAPFVGWRVATRGWHGPTRAPGSAGEHTKLSVLSLLAGLGCFTAVQLLLGFAISAMEGDGDASRGEMLGGLGIFVIGVAAGFYGQSCTYHWLLERANAARQDVVPTA